MNEYELERLFHENTKNRNLTKWYHGKPPESWTEIEYKEYDRATSVSLERPHRGAETMNPLLTQLQARESPSAFADQPLSAGQVSGLLTGVLETHTGADDTQLRGYPSAGARFPLELYLSLVNVDSIENGLYHVNVIDQSLEKVREEPAQHEIAEQSGQALPRKASIIAFVTAVPERTRRKYGIRGYRFLLIEAGHLMQNLLLAAQSLGFGGRPWGAFLDREVDEILDLTDAAEETIYMGLFGVPD